MITRPQHHQVKGDKEGPDSRRLSALIVPSQREPRDSGDHRHTDRVDLFVRGGLVPNRVGGRPHHRPACGADREHPPLFDHPGQHSMPDQEEKERSHRARSSGQEVDAHGYRQTQRGQQETPYPRECDKKRIARGMRNTQEMPRSDVLAGVPPSRGGRQGHDIQAEDHQPQQCPFPVRRSVFSHSDLARKFVRPGVRRRPAAATFVSFNHNYTCDSSLTTCHSHVRAWRSGPGQL